MMEATTKRRPGWENLGIVETIFEEEEEEEEEEERGSLDSSSSPTLSLSSPSLSSPSTPLFSRVKAWSLHTGQEPNVVIQVQGSCFNLHKDPLVSRSKYLERQLTESSQITLSPPLNITVDIFTLVADFCYGGHLFITPFNVAALLIAAELLEMVKIAGEDDENLRRKTEAYFCRTVAVNQDYAMVVLRSCISLMPDAETTASLVSRCIEALSLTEHGGDVDGDNIMSCFDDVKVLSPEDFQLIVDSLYRRSTGNHDFLYRILDLYLKEHRGNKITEEQKTRMCNYIDCSNLSPQLLMHAVQNPRMPLRFIVQAMFIEQLNTRRSVLSAATTISHHHQPHRRRPSKDSDETPSVTLGAMLHRDGTVRQLANLKSTMDATSSRIQSLEKELDGMRKIIEDSESLRNVMNSHTAGPKSESFRFSSERKVERGQRGSVSSGSLREEERAVRSSSESGEESPRVQRHFARKLMNGLRSAFRVSGLGPKKNLQAQAKKHDSEGGNGSENVIVIKKDVPFHHKSHSLFKS